MRCFIEKGFTLIELLTVIVIVGILASVAIPMMRGNIDRAKKTEAVAALGLLRTVERAYYSEYDRYLPVAADGADAANLAILGIAINDIDGRFFSHHCYSVDGATGTIRCDPTQSQALKSADVRGWVNQPIIMDADGTIHNY